MLALTYAGAHAHGHQGSFSGVYAAWASSWLFLANHLPPCALQYSLKMIFFCSLLHFALGTGKGPVGIYAINDRYAIFGDSNHNGLFVIDVRRGGIVGQKLFPSLSSPEEWASMTSVASCPACNFLYVTTTHEPCFWRVDMTKAPD